MSGETYVILSGLLSFGVPLAFAIRELLLLRPGGGGWRERPAPAPVPGPESGGEPPLRALPAELLVPAVSVRSAEDVRVRELV